MAAFYVTFSKQNLKIKVAQQATIKLKQKHSHVRLQKTVGKSYCVACRLKADIFTGFISYVFYLIKGV